MEWGEPTEKQLMGTILIAEGIHRHLVLAEWDVAGQVELRRVTVAGAHGFFQIALEQRAHQVHLVVASAEDASTQQRSITYYSFDESLRLIAEHPIGTGYQPTFAVSRSAVAIAWSGGLDPERTQHVRTFRQPEWAPSGTLDDLAPESLPAVLQISGSERVVVRSYVRPEGSGTRSLRLTAYNPRTLAEEATWTGAADHEYSTGIVQGHVALHGDGRLTELTDSLEELRVRSLAGSGSFLEDPETGGVVAAAGEVLLRGALLCCSWRGQWIPRMSTGKDERTRTHGPRSVGEPRLLRRGALQFTASGLGSWCSKARDPRWFAPNPMPRRTFASSGLTYRNQSAWATLRHDP